MEQCPTNKQYLSDSYTVLFEAVLISCSRLANGRYEAILNESYFYPGSGGQPADAGAIGGARVLDVREREDGVVVHEIDAPVEAGTVACRVDWETRFDHMQQHTGQHVLSRAFIETCGAETLSFHMGDDSCTIDLDTTACSDENIEAAENLANSIILHDREIVVRNMTPSDAKREELRKAVPDGASVVRLVDIRDFDVCPCCGTHVGRTGELGVIKVLKSEKVKGTVRVHFKVGKRAVRDYRQKHAILTAISNRFTTAFEHVPDAVDKLVSENRELRKTIQKATRRLLAADKERLLANALDHNGTRYVAEVVAESDPGYLKALSSSFKNERRCIVLLGSDAGTVVCNASADMAIALANAVIEAAERLGGTGGGSGVFATVTLPAPAHVDHFLKEVRDHVKNSM